MNCGLQPKCLPPTAVLKSLQIPVKMAGFCAYVYVKKNNVCKKIIKISTINSSVKKERIILG